MNCTIFWIVLVLHWLFVMTPSTSMRSCNAFSCLDTQSGELEVPSYMCTDSVDWIGENYNKDDCQAAVHKLYTDEVYKHTRQNFEFSMEGSARRTRLNNITLPQRYRASKSTLLLQSSRYYSWLIKVSRILYPGRSNAYILCMGSTSWTGPYSKARTVPGY